jgi:hypothetical protein
MERHLLADEYSTVHGTRHVFVKRTWKMLSPYHTKFFLGVLAPKTKFSEYNFSNWLYHLGVIEPKICENMHFPPNSVINSEKYPKCLLHYYCLMTWQEALNQKEKFTEFVFFLKTNDFEVSANFDIFSVITCF